MVDKTLHERAIALEQLTRDDWKLLLLELQDDEPASRELRQMIYQMRISFDLVWSVDRLDRVSGKLSKRLIALTWVIVALTAALLIEPIILLLKVGVH